MCQLFQYLIHVFGWEKTVKIYASCSACLFGFFCLFVFVGMISKQPMDRLRWNVLKKGERRRGNSTLELIQSDQKIDLGF